MHNYSVPTLIMSLQLERDRTGVPEVDALFADARPLATDEVRRAGRQGALAERGVSTRVQRVMHLHLHLHRCDRWRGGCAVGTWAERDTSNSNHCRTRASIPHSLLSQATTSLHSSPCRR